MANETRFTFGQQIECVVREISIRKRVYPNWVKAHKMTQVKADFEIAAMEAVLWTLTSLNRQYEEATK